MKLTEKEWFELRKNRRRYKQSSCKRMWGLRLRKGDQLSDDALEWLNSAEHENDYLSKDFALLMIGIDRAKETKQGKAFNDGTGRFI